VVLVVLLFTHLRDLHLGVEEYVRGCVRLMLFGHPMIMMEEHAMSMTSMMSMLSMMAVTPLRELVAPVSVMSAVSVVPVVMAVMMPVVVSMMPVTL